MRQSWRQSFNHNYIIGWYAARGVTVVAIEASSYEEAKRIHAEQSQKGVGVERWWVVNWRGHPNAPGGPDPHMKSGYPCSNWGTTDGAESNAVECRDELRALGVPAEVVFADRPDLTYKGEGTMAHPDISEPLNIKRLDLIARLEENLAEEQKKREEVAAKLAESKQEAIGFIKKSPERVLEWVVSLHGYGPEAFVKGFDNGAYTPKESVPTKTEDDLEKFVRVLKMSADETVSLTPQQDLYHLL